MGATGATGATGPPGGVIDDTDNDNATDCEGPVGEYTTGCRPTLYNVVIFNQSIHKPFIRSGSISE